MYILYILYVYDILYINQYIYTAKYEYNSTNLIIVLVHIYTTNNNIILECL